MGAPLKEAEEDQVEADPLFYGVTIPAMLGGVPTMLIPGFIAIATVPTAVTMNPIWLALVAPLYMMSYALCRDDPHFFGRLWLYCKTKRRTGNKFYWRGSSYSPTGRFRRPGERMPGDEG